jgi:2-keto-4-pentenoate hydratase/2-oxohepta-3-ene-1,7-dioic acid hydratase in catechol pathway
MKFASFTTVNGDSWGLVEGSDVIDVGVVLPDLPDLRSAIAAGSWERVAQAAPHAPRHRMEDIRWRPVIPNPDKIFCVGLNYEEHRKETGRSLVANPVIFSRFANSQTAHGVPLVRPRVSDTLDYEGELAVIIGKTGRYITQEDAFSYVAGYACYNEVTVREWQNHTHQWLPGKNFLASGAFGPWMVTPDEIADLDSARLTTRLNGQVMQDATIDQMIFSIPRLIEYCSTFTQLEPGDVIVSGTPGGVGAKRSPPVFMKPGDRVEVEISGVGRLENTVVDEQ